jgi:hypothetical protein
MPLFEIKTHKQAVDFLVQMNLEPYWEPSGSPPVLFRKVRNTGGPFNVTRQRKEKTWDILIATLKMRTEEDVKRVRQEVLSRLK